MVPTMAQASTLVPVTKMKKAQAWTLALSWGNSEHKTKLIPINKDDTFYIAGIAGARLPTRAQSSEHKKHASGDARYQDTIVKV